MSNNLNLITELYDIKRQNIDWEIKLENSCHLKTTIDLFSDSIDERVDDLPKNSFDITLIPNQKPLDNSSDDQMTVDKPIGVNTQMDSELSLKQLNGTELIVDKSDHQLAINSANGQRVAKSASNHVYDGIKNVEQYVERRKINGITWYYCLWNNCNYGSNKSNHLVRHIRGHTGERPYACDWPNCGKKFTDSWKRKDHILSHNKKLYSINQLNNKLISSTEQKSDNNLNNFVEMLNTNNSICEPIDVDLDVKPELSLVLRDNNKVEDSEQDLNMFIPEVIVSEIESNNVNNSETISAIDDLKAIQQFIERTTKDGKVWYLCKFSADCSYGSIKNQHLIRHLRSVHQFGVRPFPCEWPECGKSFTESYKLKEHQLTHYRKLITTVGNNNKNSMNLIFDTKKVDDRVDNKIIISEAKDWVPPINDQNQTTPLFNRMTFNVSDAQTAQLLSPKKVVMSIKSVEQYVERRKIDGITRYFCQWPNCSYSSNKSNHLVRHITSHTNERKEVCDFPGCGKKFTDVWKLRDHQLCHTSGPNNFSIGTQIVPVVTTSMALVPTITSDVSVNDEKEKPTFYTPNPHKILIESLRSPPLPLLPTLPFPENYDKTHVRHKSPTDVVMSIKNVEQYVERRKVNGITFYFCKWSGCNYGSNKSNHLVRHVRSHTGERPYPCDQCDKKFTDSWKLKDHKSIHAKKQLEKTMTDQKIAFLNFLQNLSQNNSLIEKHNDFIDNSPDSSVKAITFGDTYNPCNNSVEKSVKLEENLILNELNQKSSNDMNFEENMNQMEDNSREVQEMDLLVPQVIIDESDESYVNFSSTAEESASELIIPNQPIQYRPSISLDNAFSGVLSIKNVEQYVDKVLKSDGNWYVCKWTVGTESCGFSTQKSSYITQHVYRHMGERPYKCQWTGCDAKFNKKQNLKLHMTAHTGAQTFRCGYPNCYYQAISLEALTAHQKKHFGDKTFQCQWNGCSQQFATELELMRHSKIHSGVRLHSCHFPNCDYASKYRNKLQIHIRRHTNTKPFICQIENCGKSFIVKDKLKRHENTVHKDLFIQQIIQL